MSVEQELQGPLLKEMAASGERSSDSVLPRNIQLLLASCSAQEYTWFHHPSGWPARGSVQVGLGTGHGNHLHPRKRTKPGNTGQVEENAHCSFKASGGL